MGATPNRGFEAAGLQKLGVLVKELETLLPMFGATSEPGKAVLDAIRALAKHIPTGSVSPASQRNTIQDMMMRSQQNGQMQQQLDKSRMQPPGGGGAPAAAGAG
jgi:hypothetical protein